MAMPVRVVGLGGSLRAESTSRTALQVALDGAAASGAVTQLIWVRDRIVSLGLHHTIDTGIGHDVIIDAWWTRL